MPPIRRFPLATFWLSLVLVLIPVGVSGQVGQPYTLEQLELLLAARQSTARILGLVQPECLSFRMDAEAVERLRAAGAEDELLEALRSVCYRGREPDLYNPGSAALRSLFLPGLGQFSTGRPVVGAVFLAGWAGALGAGFLTREVTVECMDRVTGECPPNKVLSETVKRPMLAVGVGGAVALAVVSALEARSGAKKANARLAEGGEGRGGVRVVVLPSQSVRSAREMILVQVRF